MTAPGKSPSLTQSPSHTLVPVHNSFNNNNNDNNNGIIWENNLGEAPVCGRDHRACSTLDIHEEESVPSLPSTDFCLLCPAPIPAQSVLAQIFVWMQRTVWEPKHLVGFDAEYP